MRVLHVIDSLELAGAETLVKDLALRSRNLGIQADVYVLQSSDTELKRILLEQDARVYSGPPRSVYDLRQVLSLAAHLREHRYEVVHVHLFPAQLWAALAMRYLPEPRPALVTTEHNTENRRRRQAFRLLDKWMYNQYAAIACISQATSDKLLKWLPELAGRTLLVGNGVDVDRFATAAKAPLGDLGVGQGPVVMCVGRFELQKGQDVLIRAMAEVENARLVLVGDGVRHAEYAGLAESLKLSERIRFLGRRTDVAGLLKSADVYVQPSLWEGFGIAALEAMACGLPVIASGVPGLAEVVGDAGVLVPPDSPSKLAEALRSLLDEPDRCRQMGALCAQRARRFDIAQTAAKYHGLYEQVLKARGPSSPGESLLE